MTKQEIMDKMFAFQNMSEAEQFQMIKELTEARCGRKLNTREEVEAAAMEELVKCAKKGSFRVLR